MIKDICDSRVIQVGHCRFRIGLSQVQIKHCSFKTSSTKIEEKKLYVSTELVTMEISLNRMWILILLTEVYKSF